MRDILIQSVKKKIALVAISSVLVDGFSTENHLGQKTFAEWMKDIGPGLEDAARLAAVDNKSCWCLKRRIVISC